MPSNSNSNNPIPTSRREVQGRKRNRQFNISHRKGLPLNTPPHRGSLRGPKLMANQSALRSKEASISPNIKPAQVPQQPQYQPQPQYQSSVFGAST